MTGLPNVGSATVGIVPDLTHFNGLIDRALGPLSGKFGKFTKAAAVGLGGLTVAGAAVGGALVSIGDDFHQASNRIRVDTGATGKRLDGLEASFKRVISTTPASFRDAADAVGELSARLHTTGRPLETVAVAMLRLSRLTGENLSEDIPAITRLFGDWSIATDRQVGTLNKLYRISQVSGIRVGELARYMVQFGSPLRQLGLGFDFSAAMFARFEREGVNIQTVLPGLRFALRTFAKEGKDPAKGLIETFDAIRRLGRGAAATQLAFRVFGARAGPDIAAAVEEGRFALDRYIRVMNKGRDTLQRTAADTSSLSGKFDLFRNRVLVLLEPVARRVFDTINRGMGAIMRIDFRRVIAETAGVRAVFAGFGTASFPVLSAVTNITLGILRLGLSFSQTRLGMALLGAAAGALLGRMVGLGVAFAVGKIVSFVSSIRDVIATFGVLRAVYIAQTGATNASTVSLLRFAVAESVAGAASKGLAAAIASTGLGALFVIVGTVAGAILGMSQSTDRATTSARDLNQALEQQADALRAVRDIDIDVAQRKANLRSANVAVESSEKRVRDLRKSGQKGTLDYKQAEADLQQARVQQTRAARDLGDAESDSTTKRRAANVAVADSTTRIQGRVQTLRDERNAVADQIDREKLRIAFFEQEKRQGMPANEDELSAARKRLATLTDQLAARDQSLNAQFGRIGTIRNLQNEIAELTGRMGGLNKGSSAYRATARKLQSDQDALDQVLRGVPGATARAARGFSTLSGTAGGLGGALGDVTTYTQNATNRLLTAFGAKPLSMGVRPFRMTSGQKFMNALGLQHGGVPRSMRVPGTGTGDKVHMQALVEPGEEVFVLNRNASEHLRGLHALNREIPRFQTGGQLAGVNPAVSALSTQLERMFGLTVTSTTGGGHAANSYHYRGMAADLAGPTDAMNKAAAWILGSGTFRSLLEGIHNPNLSVKNGSIVPPSFWGGAVWGEHANHIHIALSGLAKQVASTIARLTVSGGTAPMRAIVSRAADRLRSSANRYLAAHMGGGGDTTDFMRGPGKIVGASTFGGPFDPGTGHTGYKGDVLDGKMAYAELRMGTALGNLPYRKLLGIMAGSRSVAASKLDIGLGGDPVDGHETDIDLWVDTGHALGLPDVWKGLVKLTGLRRGGALGELPALALGGRPRVRDSRAARQHIARKHPKHKRHKTAHHRDPVADALSPFLISVDDALAPLKITVAELTGRIEALGNQDSLLSGLAGQDANAYVLGDDMPFITPTLRDGENIIAGMDLPAARRIYAHAAAGASSDPQLDLQGQILDWIGSQADHQLLSDVTAGILSPTFAASGLSFAPGSRIPDAQITNLNAQIQAMSGQALVERAAVHAVDRAIRERNTRRTLVLRLANAAKRRLTGINKDMDRLTTGSLRSRLHAALDSEASGRRVQDAETERSHLTDLIANERSNKHPDRASITGWEARIRQIGDFIRGEHTGSSSSRADSARLALTRNRLTAERKDIGDELSQLSGSTTKVGTGGMLGTIAAQVSALSTGESTMRTDIVELLTNKIPTLRLDLFGLQQSLPESERPVLAPGAGGAGADDSARVALLETLLQQSQQAAYVANQQFAALKSLPFAGVFHEGGIVPGPLGAEALALVQGGETITPVGGGSMPSVILNGDLVSAHRDPVEMLLGDKRFPIAVEAASRRRIRSSKGSGRAGVLRRG